MVRTTNSSKSRSALLVAAAAVVLFQFGSKETEAYLPSSVVLRRSFVLSSTTSSSSTTSTDFSSFADSLESDLDEPNEDFLRTSSDDTSEKPWQAKLDDLLDPSTNLADRQILLSELLTSNDKIRDDVLDALTNRKIDPLLTPSQKKLQEGTRAVVRQLANDILPQITQSAAEATASSQTSSTSGRRKPPSLPFFPPSEVQSIGNRLFTVVSNQIQKNLEDLQDDLTDPINKIPARLEKQREEVLQEARNVFLEKPEGLEEPPYTVLEETDLYEIRSYEAYSVASTAVSMSEGIAGPSAFNALAAYIFGGNDENKVMEMTTPVTTTSTGEMRFYLANSKNDRIPEPNSEKTESGDAQHEIEIVKIPEALLAVRKFTGFATDGEVARQKDTLLQALETDGVELDVAHGAVVPHVVFQYNPPYTLPMVRCNEIGVPVRSKSAEEPVVLSLKEEWSIEEDDDEEDEEGFGEDIAPSDVE